MAVLMAVRQSVIETRLESSNAVNTVGPQTTAIENSLSPQITALEHFQSHRWQLQALSVHRLQL